MDKSNFTFYFIFVFIAIINSSNANNYYISSTGDNNNKGTRLSPWTDISFAISQVTPESGDTITILPGHYLIQKELHVPLGINIIGNGTKPEDTKIEYAGNVVLNSLLNLDGAKKKKSGFKGIEFFNGNQVLRNFMIEGNSKVLTGVNVVGRNKVKLLHLLIQNCRNGGIFMGLRNAQGIDVPRVTGQEIGYCRVFECARQHDNKANYHNNITIGGWEGGTMHHCEIVDTAGGVYGCGYGLEFKSTSRTKIYNNNILINTNIRGHTETNRWPVFAILSGFTYGTEFFNNRLNGCMSCEHRLDDTDNPNVMQIPGVLNLMICNNKFIGDRVGGVFTQAIELYVDHCEISGNYFENFQTCIQSWKGQDTLKNVLIHHNVFNGSNVGEKAICLTVGGGSHLDSIYTVYDNFKIYNNIFDDYQRAIYNYHGFVNNMTVKNNVFMNSGYAWEHTSERPSTDVLFDNNLTYNTQFTNNQASATIINSIESTVPGFKLSGNKPAEWYTPANTESAIVDAGYTINNITDGYAGTAPDLGVYELNGIYPTRLFAPIITPHSARFIDSLKIKITDLNNRADIYYTTDGTIPSTTNGTKYTSPFLLKDSVIKAIAVKDNMISSYIIETTYASYNQQAPIPKFSIPGGTYQYPQIVSITTPLEGAEILYREDNNTPVFPHSLFEYPFYIDQNTTISAVTIANHYHQSEKQTQKYVIESKMPDNGIVINNTNTRFIEYSSQHNWELFSDKEDYYNSDYHQVYGEEQYAIFSFHGTGCALITETQKSNPEIVDIYLDEELLTKIDLNSLTKIKQDTVFVITGLDRTNHTIKIQNADSYRYLSIDAFVCFDCDTISGISGVLANSQPELYPNPASDYIFLKNSLPYTHLQAQAIDLTGRIYPIQIENGRANISAIKAGYYILVVKEKQIIRSQFIKH